MINGSILQLIIYVCLTICFFIILYLIFRNPFKYPYFKYYFDISGKKNPNIGDLIDEYLIEKRLIFIEFQKKKIEAWKKMCENKIEKSILKKYRTKQFNKIIDDRKAYNFYLIRKQTRYRQSNYVRTSYKVDQIIKIFPCDYKYLYDRNELLKSINYECTINKYNIKDQRKLMTKELRNKIIIRDNFTCQICGKHMPDEVGLHVDHIVPISKGGKTVPSNLQVLCSKCNGSKSNK